MIDPTTVAYGAGLSSNFETYIAHGQALGQGYAHNAHDVAIVRADLRRLAGEISG
ncbi:MAG TPA: hypothetical protein VE777_06840 [Gaiellales bacterium]|nr:hypothetical protein [Gaiellales bacterium]